MVTTSLLLLLVLMDPVMIKDMMDTTMPSKVTIKVMVVLITDMMLLTATTMSMLDHRSAADMLLRRSEVAMQDPR
jgi:hypothetical protein